MVKEICKDIFLLSLKAIPATPDDMSIAIDLIDTLNYHKDECVGMAANMIGQNKNIIIFDDNGTSTVMFNPEIVSNSEPFSTEEGCLSLNDKRPTKRYKKIKVRYQNMDFQVRIKTYTGWTAQIIQHEIDHCKGILI